MSIRSTVLGCLIACWFPLLCVDPSCAATERRVALVIGNSDYEQVGRLDNPSNDAEAVAASLRGAGFDNVVLKKNLSREKLLNALREFGAAAEKSDWAVIYYAGHGIEMGGINYLIPVDARVAVDRDLQFEGIPMSQALASIEGARKLRLLILDACRDNPFASTIVHAQGATRSIGRGLDVSNPMRALWSPTRPGMGRLRKTATAITVRLSPHSCTTSGHPAWRSAACFGA